MSRSAQERAFVVGERAHIIATLPALVAPMKECFGIVRIGCSDRSLLCRGVSFRCGIQRAMAILEAFAAAARTGGVARGGRGERSHGCGCWVQMRCIAAS